MGLFSNLLGQAKKLSKLGNAVANIKNMLDRYESDQDVSYLLVSAWICKVGILDMMMANNWERNYVAYVPFDGHQRKMTMEEILSSTVYRLMDCVCAYGNKNFEENIRDVLRGGMSFDELDAQIPQQIKEVIENPKYT